MAKEPKFSNACVEAEANALADLLDNGYLRVYDGTKPATADTAITSQVLLAELRFANPAETGVTGGILLFDAFTPDSSANATGTASWFRAFKSDGTTSVMDGTVGTSAADAIINTTAIVTGAAVSVTSAGITISKG